MRSDYGEIWKRWPKKEGLGIPGPAHWADSRSNTVIPFGMLLKCIAEVRFSGLKGDISYEDITEEELHRGMHNPVQAHRDYQQRQVELLDFLRRVAFLPSQGCVPIGRMKRDPVVPDKLPQMFYTPIETHALDETTEMVEQKGSTKTEETADTTAGGPLGAPPAEVTVGPQLVRMAPETQK